MMATYDWAAIEAAADLDRDMARYAAADAKRFA